MPTTQELTELAKRHLDYPRTVQDEATLNAYIDELRKHMGLSAKDINFSVTLEPKTGLGYVTCLETACKKVKVPLTKRKNAPDGGKSIGLGSLAPYRVHASQTDHIDARESRLAMPLPGGSKTPSSSPAKAKRGRESLSMSPQKRQRIQEDLATPLHKSRPPLSQPSTPARRRPTRPPNSAPGPSRVRYITASSVPGSSRPSRAHASRLSSPTVHQPISVEPLAPPRTPSPSRTRKSPILLNATPSEEVEDPALDGQMEVVRVDSAASPSRATPPRDTPRPHEEPDTFSSPAEADAAFDAEETRDRLNEVDREINRVTQALHRAEDKEDKTKADMTRIENLTKTREGLLTESHRINAMFEVAASRPVQVMSVTQGPVASGSNVQLQDLDAMEVDSDIEYLPHPQPQLELDRPVASGSNVQLEDQPQTLAQALDGEMYHVGMFTSHHIPPATPARSAPTGRVEDGEEVWDDDMPVDLQGRVQPFLGYGAGRMDVRRYVVNAGNAESFNQNSGVKQALRHLGLRSLVEPLPGMKAVLMPHQVIGVSWMFKQECLSTCKGGILADEMGLGKTVQVLGLMAKNQPLEGQITKKSTLIVAPVSVLAQWYKEIEDKTDMGLRILIYHGQSKPEKLETVQNYDVVITTYDTLLYDWSLYPALKQKRMAVYEDDNRGITREPANLLHRIEWFRVILDEAHIIRNRDAYKSEAVAALNASYRWCLTGTPIVNTLEDAYPYLRFLRCRPKNDWPIFRKEILGIHSKRFPQEATRRLRETLKPIILRRTKKSELNGKPLITLPPKTVELVWLEFSREERDVYTMVETRCQNIFNRFLRAGTVLKNYMTVLAMLHCLREVCSHPTLITQDGYAFIRRGEQADNSTRNAELLKVMPITGPEFVQRMQDRYKRIALARIAPQRVHAGNTSVVPESEIVCSLCHDQYNDPTIIPCGHVFCRRCINLYISDYNPVQGKGGRHPKCPMESCGGYVWDFALFSRAIFEPTEAELQPYREHNSEEGGVQDGDQVSAASVSESGSEAEVDGMLAGSDDDSDDSVVHGPKPVISRLAREKAKQLEFLPSTKMRSMMDSLLKLREEHPDEKVIIISQWTRCLDLVSNYLTENNFYHVKYQGDMTVNKRNQAVDEFMHKGKATVMLMSLRCGGVGLDLKRANNVINLEPAWSNAIEQQAYDRVHRLGQERPVHIQRLVIRNSVEDRILEIQSNKQTLADGSLGEGEQIDTRSWTVRDFATAFNLAMDGSVLSNGT